MHRDTVRWVRQSVVLTLAFVFASCTNDNSPMQPTLTASYVTPTGLVSPNPPQIFIGAGDISSCSNSGDEQTAQILDANPVGTVFNIGDDAYDNGTTAEFACYHSTWGRHKARTKPTTGNHEYNTSGATGYYTYFGAAGHPSSVADSAGFYSFDLGAWHIISLNSSVARSVNSKQDKFLAADLAAHPNQCTLAYWHHPLYSSGSSSGGQSIASMRPFWDRLYAAHADLVLNGHRHFYDRMAPMKPDGSADPTNGIRTIIAGMGGIGGGNVSGAFPTSQIRNGDTFGVLKLYLYDDSYAWKFIPVAGKTFTDSGSTACHFSGGGGGGGVSSSNSSLSASPGSFTQGSGSSTITATVRDGNNNAMSGVNVVFSSTGSGNTFTPPSATTNGSGQATSTFTSSVAEAKTVSATGDGTPINQTAPVTVNSSGGGGGGTITQTLLASGGNGTNLSAYATTSISPAANALVTVAVRMRRSSGALTPTVTGGGMTTWTQVATVDYDPITSSTGRLVVFRAMSASPGSGPVNITFSGSVSNADWVVSQWTGVDQSGSNGSGAIGQTGPASGNSVTTLTVPLAAFGNANNVGFGLVGAAINSGVTPGSGLAEITEASSGENTVLEGAWGVNRNTIQASWTSANAAMLGLEIKAGTPSGPVVSASQSTVAATSPITAGGAASTITVTAKDGSGNPISGATVVLAATGNNNSLTQPVGTTALDGTITGSLSSTTAEDKQVSATISGVAITQKPNVTVTPGLPATLAYTTQPSNTAANAPINPAVVVEIRDAWNNKVNSGANVTMDFGTNAGSGTLAGTLAQAAVNGVATFSDLAINNIANGYTLKASSTALTDALSNSFNITPPVPSAALSTVVAGTPSFTAGGNSGITVTVNDGLGNAMSGVTVTLSSSVVGDVVTQPGSTTDGSGVATGNVAATSAGQRTITAVAGGITITQKPTVTVTAGAADAGQSTLTALPSTITQTSGTSTITVTVRDQYSNLASGSNVVLFASGTGNTLGGGGLTNSSGVATGTLSSSVAEVKNVSATADGTPITQTQNVTVTPPSSGITHTLLTAGGDIANQKIYTTATIAPAANALVTIAVIGHTSGTASVDPIVTGGGMSSWAVVASITLDPIATPHKRMTIFRAMSAAPGSGPITINFAATTESNAAWIVSQWTGVNTTGTNGAGAIGQVLQTGRVDGVTSISATMAALSSPNNVAYGVIGTNGSAIGINPGAGFTEISEQKPAEGTNSIVEALFGANQTVPAASWTGAFNAAILAVEIKVGP